MKEFYVLSVFFHDTFFHDTYYIENKWLSSEMIKKLHIDYITK